MAFFAGLKAHAVTLYEAGKLGDSSVAEMCEDLRKVEGTKLEGELQQFANHAFSLRLALECLRSGGIDPTLADNESAEMVEQISKDAEEIFSFADEQSSSLPLGSPLWLTRSQGMAGNSSFLTSDSLQGISGKALPYADTSAVDGQQVTDMTPSQSSEHGSYTVTRSENPVDMDDVSQFGTSPSVSDGVLHTRPRTRKGRKYRVDVVRCESLAGLAPATLQRVFRRDYSVVVSMIPLTSPPFVAPDGEGPVHFGPPCRAALSPWMRLLLYHVSGSGPTSVALMRGLRLRSLPPPLTGCAKALVWSWDGTVVHGVGGKFEGTVVQGTILLHCLNSLLKHSAVFVQPFRQGSLSSKGDVVTRDIPLPLDEPDLIDIASGGQSRAADGFYPDSSIVNAAKELHLDSLGYLSFLRTRRCSEGFEAPVAAADIEDEYVWVPQSVEFGVPLFDTDLCKRVCEGAVRHRLFHPISVLRHRDQMLLLRKRLHEFISDHQANGVVSRLTYVGDRTPATGPAELTSFASGKWMLPSEETSTPLSPAFTKFSRSEKHRRRLEVMSFDGEIPRSRLEL